MLLGIINSRLLTGSTNITQMVMTVVKVASGVKGHTQVAPINARNLAHDSVLSLLHPCVPTVTTLAGEIAAICLHM